MTQLDLFAAGALVYETGAPRPARRQDIRAAVAACCHDNGLTYVALRLMAQAHRDPDLDPDCVDCLVYPARDEEAEGLLLLACPYLQYAGRGGQDLQRWAARRLPGLATWGRVFGEGFRAALVGLREGRPVAVGLDDYEQTGFARCEPLIDLL